MARRTELENSSPHGEISSSTIRPFPYHQEVVTRHLSISAPHDDEDSPGVPCGPPDEISRDGSTWTQLRKTPTRNHRRRARVGSGKDYQLPTPRTIQEAPVPCSMEGIPTVRRFLGSRVGSFRSGSNRRLLRHTLPRPTTVVI